jgi:hypothetical protein
MRNEKVKIANPKACLFGDSAKCSALLLRMQQIKRAGALSGSLWPQVLCHGPTPYRSTRVGRRGICGDLTILLVTVFLQKADKIGIAHVFRK